MSYPKLTVVIPTRERCDTLPHTLRTVVEQTYHNLEIIVSDNASEDETFNVVSSFQDPRIRYIKTDNRVGMSENYEFALGHVTGDYVMYLGDDDGLLPNACQDVVKIINATSSKAIIWNKPNYNWGTSIVCPNHISVKFNYDLIEICSKILLKAVAAGKTSYGRLPVIYSGFVSLQSISNIKRKTGNFFHSITPDVYSGIVLAEEIDTYLYSFRPFSINGASRHSTGNSTMNNDEKGKLFFDENSIPINEEMPIIRGSIQTHVAEAFLQAQKVGLLRKFILNKKRIHQNIFQEILKINGDLRYAGLKVLGKMNISKKLSDKIQLLLHDTTAMKLQQPDYEQILANKENGILNFNSKYLAINNSYEAAFFIGTLFGDYTMPVIIKRANYFAFLLVYIKRKIQQVFNKYIIPI